MLKYFDEQRSAGAGASATESVLQQGVFAATYPGKINFMQIAAGSASKPVI